jgi:hypothetical protein
LDNPMDVCGHRHQLVIDFPDENTREIEK